MKRTRLFIPVWGIMALFCVFVGMASTASAAPYAAMVIDARTGEVLHSRNADTRLHPASLTKMMTLYITFEAIRNGEITLDTPVHVSANAAAEPPSRLGLRQGQTIRLRYLIRAAAVRSANDAATAIGEAIGGSEAAFARRMNRTAQALGMTRTTFRNANGLTTEGHLSTARDMTTLGRRLWLDYPEYYNLFSRRSADAGIATVRSTNRAFLDAYRGADGIKTGYTRAAGFNLVGSAERNGVRIIATVFGGSSTAARNQRVMELLDMGFARAPAHAAIRRPPLPTYGNDGLVGRATRANGAVTSSLYPVQRPGPSGPSGAPATESPELLASVESALVEAINEEGSAAEPVPPDTANTRPRPSVIPVQRPTRETALTERDTVTELASLDSPSENADAIEPVREIVTRASSSGSRLYGVSLGRYPTQASAERLLLQTALSELGTLGDALRNVVHRTGGFEAQFAGMTQAQADTACARLMARNVTCSTFGP